MLTPTTTAAAAARFAALGSRGLQLPTALIRGPSCPYAAAFSSLSRQQCAASRMPSRQFSTKNSFFQPNPARKSTTSVQCQFAARRHASTVSASSAAGTSSPSASEPKLNWNTFFQLRKTRRRFQLASSIVTMAIGGTAGAVLLVNMEMDWLLSKVPMDPIFALGIVTLSFAGLGWLAGPSLGSAIFYTFKSGVKRPMGVKESEFFNRIKKNRVDPTNSSLSGNAVPDFYGEKISSVAGYRQWLKDQRAFNKKRTSFV
ncbi:Pam17-domain-containing protein [Xylaria bambusicola]|uniref:Pam17-domain-containing protein n=1 Tax=Xylaria bambusicola TaxID=326684 RepID=UPI002007807F|nr:Pam17-domain-containing protein [Xylaria bambusicola]KAI0516851.1 Pam17-domain-containing protein [Xylaria bambusicola]